jgi:thiamine biosynthesis lipoprotein
LPAFFIYKIQILMFVFVVVNLYLKTWTWTVLVIIIFVQITCAGCGQKSASLQDFSGEEFIMNTLVRVHVICEDEKKGRAALKQAFDVFKKIDHLTNRFPEGGPTASSPGDVLKINGSAGLEPVEVSVDTVRIIQRSQYFARLTGGAFDITIGPVMDSWGFGKDIQYVPTDEEISRALSLVDYRKVEVDPGKATVFLPQPGMSLDLGGVAKGYAMDEAVKALREAGIQHALINAGGSVYALGTRPDGEPWRVGIQDPRNSEDIIAILSLKDSAAVTSGDYQRYFEQEGVYYHHIIDPSTGKQARDLIQTTVIAESTTDADILSTALFVLGPRRGMSFVEELPGTEAVLIGPDKLVSVTAGLINQLTFTGDGGYQIAS